MNDWLEDLTVYLREHFADYITEEVTKKNAIKWAIEMLQQLELMMP